MKPKYRKFYILEKQAAKKDGSTEHLYYAKIDGKVEYESREAARKALNWLYEKHKTSTHPYATHIHKTDDSYSYDGNWETRYIYKIVEL